MPNKQHHYNSKDYEYMNSLSAAILQKTPSTITIVLKIWIFTIAAFIIWSIFTEIDEITRGSGKVIPYGQNKIIQNLEGGIVESILVQEGERVKKGQVIIKIKNAQSTSSSKTNKMKYEELIAEQFRLYAEANSLDFKADTKKYKDYSEQIKLSKKLFISHRLEQKAKDNTIKQQIEQRKQEYKEAQAKIKALKRSLTFVKQEITMTEPMVKEGIKSKIDFLKLQREANDIENNIQAVVLSLPRLQSFIQEYRNKRKQVKQLFINGAKEELNKITAEISRLETKQVEFIDKVNRTMVKSPVEGIVQKLFVNTVGGVVKPAQELVEIVPTNQKLYLEIKIKPKDIAFIHIGAEAKVKISAYDFAIHGGLIGKVVNISPDTITDRQENTFYVIHIQTEKNYLGTLEKPLKIAPGMIATVDIITGKKSIMHYILKPILKSKQYVFTEK